MVFTNPLVPLSTCRNATINTGLSAC